MAAKRRRLTVSGVIAALLGFACALVMCVLFYGAMVYQLAGEPDGPAVTYCHAYDKLKIVDITAHIPGTNHDFGRREEPNKIDYIFVTEGLAADVINVEPWTTVHSGIYLSDHYPVAATFKA